MIRGGESREAAAADHVAALSNDVDFLAEDNLDPMSDAEVVKLLQEMESCSRRMAAVQHRVLNQIEMRGIPAQSGLKSMPRFLEHTLHLGAADARARCRAATLLGPRELPGQTLPPWLPWTAAAQSVGLVSAEHARVIGRIMDRLPVKLDVEQRETVEFQLAEFATNTTPDDLPKIGDRILAYLDPDGSLTEDEDRQRGRGVTLGKRRVDGMSPLSGEITATLRELLEPVLAKLARPGMCNPADPESPWAPEHVDRDVLDAAANRDRRSTAQRNHDALVAFLRPERGPANLGEHRGRIHHSRAEQAGSPHHRWIRLVSRRSTPAIMWVSWPWPPSPTCAAATPITAGDGQDRLANSIRGGEAEGLPPTDRPPQLATNRAARESACADCPAEYQRRSWRPPIVTAVIAATRPDRNIPEHPASHGLCRNTCPTTHTTPGSMR
ncbi:DUF222 domain-containing protein [Nocardia sp. NBC_00511]|uniref:DUF222 domain-containing protein n=1 Tax=Nocardia sp. NBC_00511 TaxID=2903591 RepID=UPI0030DE0D2E